jgi:hypothetical protein
MPHQQSWSLSQTAHKSSGTCSSCHAVRQLHIKDGTIHLHGPRNNPCPGSRKPPLVQLDPSPSSTDDSPTHSDPPLDPYLQPASSLITLPSTLSPTAFDHPLVNVPIIKHIPKSARPACCNTLSELLKATARSKDNLSAWSDLLNFGLDILRKPPRGGKRHNLATTIKKRADNSTTANCNQNQDDMYDEERPQRK